MKNFFENATLTVNLEGKVDTSNAAGVEKEIFTLLGYGGIKYAIVSAVDKNLDPKIAASVIKRAKEEIIPAAKYLIGAIDF